MYFINRFTFLFLIALIIYQPVALRQEAGETSIINAKLLENSTLTITGSSTLHDWEVEATEFSVGFRIPVTWFNSDTTWAGEEIAALNVTVPVESLDGGKNKMNRDLREALRFEEYPEIRFIWDEVTFTGTGKTAGVTGRVMIAGVEREIEFSASLILNESSQIVATGRVPMNMRDYNIDPPTALLGIIRTDENIDLTFELYFESEE